MHPIKEDVDARLPLERATNVFWVPHLFIFHCSVASQTAGGQVGTIV